MEKIYPNLIKSDRQKVELFLNNNGLKYEENIESTYIISENNQIIATGSRYQNIIKCIAIEKKYKGGSLLNEILTVLINEIYSKGYDNIFLYTKTEYKTTFKRLGFNLIEEVKNQIVFMERSSNFSKFLKKLEKERVTYNNIGAIVMNANPFTLGHRYLIDYGINHCDFLYVFVVSEDLSMFSTKERFELVKKGTADKKNLKILSTDNYLVSSATFPSYFIEEKELLIETHAYLDSAIFKNHIAKVLNINKRFVGEEKTDKTTHIYNNTMKKYFSKEDTDINLIEIPRKTVDNEIISASKVRSLINEKNFTELKKYLPQTSLEYVLKKYKNG